MKANYLKNKSELNRMSIEVARAEIEKITQERCPKCQANMERQSIAIMCKVLATRFGFGKKRLKELIDGAEGIGTYLNQTGCDYQICIDWLRDEMGIDLNEQT